MTSLCLSWSEQRIETISFVLVFLFCCCCFAGCLSAIINPSKAKIEMKWPSRHEKWFATKRKTSFCFLSKGAIQTHSMCVCVSSNAVWCCACVAPEIGALTKRYYRMGRKMKIYWFSLLADNGGSECNEITTQIECNRLLLLFLWLPPPLHLHIVRAFCMEKNVRVAAVAPELYRSNRLCNKKKVHWLASAARNKRKRINWPLEPYGWQRKNACE